MSRKIQVLKCKCGAKYAACVEPDCYEDSDWLKDLGKCLKVVELLKCQILKLSDLNNVNATSKVCQISQTFFLRLEHNDGVCAVYFMAHYTLLCTGVSFLILIKIVEL